MEYPLPQPERRVHHEKSSEKDHVHYREYVCFYARRGGDRNGLNTTPCCLPPDKKVRKKTYPKGCVHCVRRQYQYFAHSLWSSAFFLFYHIGEITDSQTSHCRFAAKTGATISTTSSPPAAMGRQHLPDDLVCPISGQRNGVLHLHFGPSRILVGGHIAVFVHGDHACYRLVGLGLFFKQRQHFSFEKTKPPLSYICPARPSSCSYRRRAPKNFNRSFPHFSPSASPFFLGGF